MKSKEDWIAAVIEVAGGAKVDKKAVVEEEEAKAEKQYETLNVKVRAGLKNVLKDKDVGPKIQEEYEKATTAAGHGKFVAAVDQLKRVGWLVKDAIAKKSGQGLSEIGLGAEYKDEDKKVGWRAESGFNAQPEDTSYVTRYEKTPEEQQRSQAKVGNLGKLVDIDGKPVDDKKHGYVIDSKSGEIHLFDTASVDWVFADGHVEKLQGHGETGKESVLPGLILAHGQVVQRIIQHHSTPLAGGKVGGAGNVQTEGGHIREIDNVSGHYKPDAQVVKKMVNHLEDKDALVDRTLLDPDGNPLGDDEETQQKHAEEVKLAQQINDLERKIAKFERQGDLGAEYETHVKLRNQLQAKLFKKGFSIKNKEARVSVSEGLTEQEFKLVKGDAQKIAELVNKKLGLNMSPHDFTNTVNNLGGIIHIVSKQSKVTTTRQTFLDSEGNVKAIRAHNQLNQGAAEDKARKIREKQERELESEYSKHGGDAKLKELGLDPDYFDLETRVAIARGQLDPTSAKRTGNYRDGEEYKAWGGDDNLKSKGYQDHEIAVLTLAEKAQFARKKLNTTALAKLIRERLQSVSSSGSSQTTLQGDDSEGPYVGY